MKCVFCEKPGTSVVNSRKSKHGEEVWRRRYCKHCNQTFTTSEHFSSESLFVIKRNLSRKQFVYEKLFTSILIATTGGKGVDMGDSAMLARDVTAKVLKELFLIKSKYISTKEIITNSYHQLALINSFYAQKYATYSPYRLRVIQGKL